MTGLTGLTGPTEREWEDNGAGQYMEGEFEYHFMPMRR